MAISTVPLIKAAMPVPDPPPDTSTETEGLIVAYSSAQACAKFTIVSEPEFWMTTFPDEEVAASSLFLEHPAKDREHASAIMPMISLLNVNRKLPNIDMYPPIESR